MAEGRVPDLFAEPLAGQVAVGGAGFSFPWLVFAGCAALCSVVGVGAAAVRAATTVVAVAAEGAVPRLDDPAFHHGGAGWFEAGVGEGEE